MKWLLAFIALSFPLILCSCSEDKGPAPGSTVIVQIRRDALGTAAANPVPPLTISMNGASTQVSGKLVSIDRNWIVLTDAGDATDLHSGHKNVWISRSAVLLIQQDQ